MNTNKIIESLELLRATRANFVKLLNKLSPVEINQKSNSFNNSIGWNIAHSIVTFDLFAYKFSGNQPRIESSWYDRFIKGTDGSASLSIEEIESLKEVCHEQIDRLILDLNSGSMVNDFEGYETSYGFNVRNYEELIAFDNLHEALHLGYAMAQYRTYIN